MAYTKTTWNNNAPPPINATNLNKMEGGIYDAHVIEMLMCDEVPDTKQTVVVADHTVTHVLHKRGNLAIRTDASRHSTTLALVSFSASSTVIPITI